MRVVHIKNFERNDYTDSNRSLNCIVVLDSGEEHPYTWVQGDPHGLGPALDLLLIPILEKNTYDELIANYPLIDLTTNDQKSEGEG